MENRSLLNNHRLNKYLHFYDWVNDVPGFYPYVQELKDYVFRFKEIHIQTAQKLLYRSTGENYGDSIAANNAWATSKRTLVSIHIRLGDYGGYLEDRYQLPTVDSSYFTRAMKYIYEKYSVCS